MSKSDSATPFLFHPNYHLMKLLFFLGLLGIFVISDVAFLTFLEKISELEELTFFKGALFFIILWAIWRGFEWVAIYISVAIGVMGGENRFKYYTTISITILNFLYSLALIWLHIPDFNLIMIIVGLLLTYVAFRINWVIVYSLNLSDT